jgi:predicted RNA-binding Zn-ribbon protein involved in translation (DUF1610 family)
MSLMNNIRTICIGCGAKLAFRVIRKDDYISKFCPMCGKENNTEIRIKKVGKWTPWQVEIDAICMFNLFGIISLTHHDHFPRVTELLICLISYITAKVLVKLCPKCFMSCERSHKYCIIVEISYDDKMKSRQTLFFIWC